MQVFADELIKPNAVSVPFGTPQRHGVRCFEVIMREIWKDIPGFEGHYQVSNKGNVASIKSERKLLTIRLNTSGYPVVTLSLNGKSRPWVTGTLVLMAFVGQRPKNFDTSHKNGIKTDNNLENLTWESRRDNCARKSEHGTLNYGENNGPAKLKEFQVVEILKMLYHGTPQKKIAKKFNVHKNTISDINTGKKWKHINRNNLEA